MLIRVVTFGVIAFLSGMNAQAQVCTRQFDPGQVVVGFTAYKTTEKTPVSGRFRQVDIRGSVRGKKISEILKSLTATVDVSSLDTDNPPRNQTLLDSFFKHLADGMKVQGRVKSVKGDDSKGGFVLLLKMNGVERPVQMTYTLDAQAGFEAFGTIDVLREFKAKKSMEALVAACSGLHTGKDGVSKTWSEVKITLKAPVNCS
jgi:polyisoprenoid-binding protein YceI